jgi:hypothetical protein
MLFTRFSRSSRINDGRGKIAKYLSLVDVRLDAPVNGM